MTQLAIKNMVCPRCVTAVEGVLRGMGLTASEVTIGNARVQQDLTPEQTEELDRRLRAIGFELLKSEDDALVGRMKTVAIYLARRDNGQPVKLGEELPRALGVGYKRLSALFSAREGRTIEAFFIAQKVEHVKELLSYGQLTVSEIAWRTGYSSTAHLSRQFKQVTGTTPTLFRRNLSAHPRRPLDQV